MLGFEGWELESDEWSVCLGPRLAGVVETRGGRDGRCGHEDEAAWSAGSGFVMVF